MIELYENKNGYGESVGTILMAYDEKRKCLL